MINYNKYDIAIQLLIELIQTPSYSKKENQSANVLENFLKYHSIDYQRIKNNFFIKNKYFDSSKKTILLNSHHDTVYPGNSWKYNPFSPTIEGDKLIGLGSNDAGGSLVSLLIVFLELYSKNLSYNLIMSISAEEEISGKNGLISILSQLGNIDLGIVGEPTQMKMAIAEKGLIVLDCIAKGKNSHAAYYKKEDNAIYKAHDDIKWFRKQKLPLTSYLLGDCNMIVTKIHGGINHNVIPDKCNFVVDIRINELYNNIEIIDYIKKNIKSQIILKSYKAVSKIDINHPIVQRGYKIGLNSYGSLTLSDQSIMNFDSIKIGPGDSLRSHTSDEYILLSEIKSAINIYLKLLNFTF